MSFEISTLFYGGAVFNLKLEKEDLINSEFCQENLLNTAWKSRKMKGG